MDIISIILVILSVSFIFGLPSVLFCRIFKEKITPVQSFGIIMVLFSIIYSLTALFYKYSMWLMITEFVIISGILLITLIIVEKKKQKSSAKKTAGLPENALKLMLKKKNLPKILAICALSLLFLLFPIITNVPFGVDGQGFGYMSLVVKLGGSIKNLSPYHPETEWVYSPAFPIFAAFFSDITGSPLHIAMPVITAIICVFLILAAYEFGRQFNGKMFGIVFSLMVLFSGWLFTAYIDAHYAVIMATFFIIIFLSFFFRLIKEKGRSSFFYIVISSIALAGIAYVHPDTIFNLLIAFVPFYIFVFFSTDIPKPNIKKYIQLFLLVPFISVIIFLPYMVYALSVLARHNFAHIGFLTDISHLIPFFVFGGVFVPVLAFVGLYHVFKKRKAIDIFMAVWLFAIIEFSIIGFFEYLFSILPVPFDPLSLFYPFGIAWHATIIPLPFLAATAVMPIILRIGNKKPELIIFIIKKSINYLLAVCLIILLIMVFFGNTILVKSKKLPIPLFGEFSSENDVNAMLWLKKNTAEDALILNYPRAPEMYGNVSYKRFEGHWVPIIAQRKSVYFRSQPFFFNDENSIELMNKMYDAYYDPVSELGKVLVYEEGINYVFVPEIMANPDAFEKMIRWRVPPLIFKQKSCFSDADYLELVYDYGAKIYKVIYN